MLTYTMIYKIIGTDRVSAIGFGTGFTAPENRNCDTLQQTIHNSIDLGVNFIDTAPVYGNGVSETMLGQVLKNIGREKVFLASKVSPEDTSYKGVISSAEQSLKRLQTETIDLFQIHWPSVNIPLSETAEAMEKLVSDGKVRYIGVSNFQMHEIVETKNNLKCNFLASIQSEYNFFERSVEDKVLPFCKKNDMMLIAYSPLAQGNLVNGRQQKTILIQMAQKYGATPGQLVLRWLIENDDVLVIPNTSKPHRAIENAKAANFTISKEDFMILSENLKTFQQLIDVKDVRVSNDYSRKVYQTIEEAKENKMNLSPSPIELSEEMKKGNFLKPIRLKELEKPIDGKRYDLVEGRLRYWAWTIAHGYDKPIPALVWKTRD